MTITSLLYFVDSLCYGHWEAESSTQSNLNLYRDLLYKEPRLTPPPYPPPLISYLNPRIN